MPKVIIDGKTFDITNESDESLIKIIEGCGATKTLLKNKDIELKELSLVDPYTIGIGIGAVITWIIYRVSPSQKENFRNKFVGKLG